MKVRVNSTYVYTPAWIDRNHPIARGDLVRVINLHGCPPANTMGHCYVVRADTPRDAKGPFWLVSTGSLSKKEVA
jgi:hypothetical protein